MTEFEWSEGARRESWGEYGATAVKILVHVERSLTELDGRILRQKAEEIHDELLAEAISLDPRSTERREKERKELVGLFPEPIYVKEIPNGYCGMYCCRHLPWYEVTTSAGLITVGWRKRVICIDWSGCPQCKTAEVLFPGEDVTKDGKLIHAWGIEKAREYVAKILSMRTKIK